MMILAMIGLSVTLIYLIITDIRTYTLPDHITLPLIWVGLILNIQSLFIPLAHAVMGAVCGYLSLWTCHHGYRLVRRRAGMGYGDFKLFAALGAWFGWQALPYLLLFATSLGMSSGLLLMLIAKRRYNTPLPFGPCLAGAAWCWLAWKYSVV